MFTWVRKAYFSACLIPWLGEWFPKVCGRLPLYMLNLKSNYPRSMNVDTSVFHIPRVAYIGIYDPFKTSTLSKLGSSRIELLGLWNQKVQCHIRKGSLIISILSRTQFLYWYLNTGSYWNEFLRPMEGYTLWAKKTKQRHKRTVRHLQY